MALRNLQVHAAVLVFAMSSWISINSFYVELPVLGNVVPESWNLATYIVLIIQISCTVPLLYGIFKHSHPKLAAKCENLVIILMLFLTFTGLLLSTFVYEKTVVIHGVEHSVPLWIVLLIASIPCTTSDVVFLPYMNHFNSHHYLTTFFVGMGLGALVPSLLSFGQGSPTVTKVTNNVTGVTSFDIDARISFETFMYIVDVFVILSLIAFLYLMYWVRCNSGNHTPASFALVDTELKSKVAPNYIDIPIILMLALSFVIGALQNSVLPVLLQYAAQAYGQSTYHMANTLFVMTNPIFCMIQLFVTISRLGVFLALFLVTLLPTIFIAVLACLSEPIHWAGTEVLLCICAGLSAGLLAWAKTAVAQALRATEHPRALFWCGSAIQCGSCVGALTMFVLANVLHLFRGS